MYKFSLNEKTAIITGGGSGIGQAIASCFAQQGARVYILDMDEENLSSTISEIKSNGGLVSGDICDISILNNVKKSIDRFINEFDCVDILVNNAGIASIGNLSQTNEDEFDRIINVNIKGVYNCMKSCIEQMVNQGGGVILNMASIASLMGLADRFAYTMSKGAVHTMTLSVAKDYVDKNIRCNCICPARIHTPFVDEYLEKYYPDSKDEMFQKLSKAQPVGRMGTPEEVAALALFLCSDEASFITGAAYPIDGGTLSIR
jgi:NAD(P)-dependent dehydrogenase (short-subunit alcohol dehydrogenase family)